MRKFDLRITMQRKGLIKLEKWNSLEINIVTKIEQIMFYSLFLSFYLFDYLLMNNFAKL